MTVAQSRGWHFIEHDLALFDADCEDLVVDVVDELEILLGKHAAFLDYCMEQDGDEQPVR